MARFLNKHLKLGAEIYASIENRNKKSSGGVHYKLLEKYGFPLNASPDPIQQCYKFFNNKLIPHFVIGPPTFSSVIYEMGVHCIGLHDGKPPYNKNLLVMQGGFCGYDVHNIPVTKLKKFEGKTTVPSFNPGGAVKDFLGLVNCNCIKERRFIGKNVCHSVVYDKEFHDYVMSVPPQNKASELLRTAMSMYLENHIEKKFHDPTAAVLMKHPVAGTWIKGKPYKLNGEWGTTLDEDGDFVAIDVDKEMIRNFIALGV